MKKKIYYWSPCLNKVATVKATLNSAISLAKYSSYYDVKIINVFGEWHNYKKNLQDNNVDVLDLSFNYYNFLPKTGYVSSRLSYIIIFLISFFPLVTLIKKNKPDYFVAHLITSLPLILINLFNLKIKIILRISGFPKLNFFRKKLWKLSESKIFQVTCPTEDLHKNLINLYNFRNDKISVLLDPVINLADFVKKKDKKNSDIKHVKDYFIAVGRLTKQKNFLYLIKEFNKFVKKNPEENLLIFGEGELKNRLNREIIKHDLLNNIKLMGYTDNIYYYMKQSKAFILSSLWEDPGFVMIEAALCNSLVISSDCKNGPKEFLINGKAGMLFENNTEGKLYKVLEQFKNLKKLDIFKKKVLAKKNCSKFTMFRHYLGMKKIIERH